MATIVSPRVPPVAICSTRRDCSSIIQTVDWWAASVAASTVLGRCFKLLEASSKPARGVPAAPKAKLSITALILYSNSALPLVRPVMGKLMMSVVPPNWAAVMSLPLHFTAHKRASGPKTRSLTRSLLKCCHARAAFVSLGLKISTPWPDET